MMATGLTAQERLVLLKTIELDLGETTRTIDLSDTQGAFRALRVKAVQGRVTFTDIVVGYRNRANHNETRRIFLLPGERTREINPTGVSHFLAEMTFETVLAPGNRATIEIHGRQTPEDAARVRDRPSPSISSQGRGGKKKAAKRRAPSLEDAESETATGNEATTNEIAEPPETPRAAAEAPPPPPVELQAPGPVTRSATAAPLPCVVDNTCTPVQVFFGTNRVKEELPSRIAFSWRDSGALQLGGAVVTVPRRVRRESGDILRPSWWDRYVLRVPPEGDPARHFVIVPHLLQVYGSEADFLAAVARRMAVAGDYKDHAFVYVHGYRVGFDDALFRTAQIAYDLGAPRAGDGAIEPFGTAFLYSWPSAGALKDYAYDQESARVAVRHLEDFLDLIVEKTGVKFVHLIAHSMGNVPLLNALGHIVAKGETTGAKVAQVVLASPDMSQREFKALAGQIQPLVRGLTLYASSSDFALGASRRVHKNEPRAGDVVGGKPIIATGVDSIDISAITTCYFCFGHDEYVEQSDLLGDIAKLMRAGLRPPHSRTQRFKPEDLTEGLFWRYQ
jgi:esterase/lipase superfamily enzyme